MSAWRRSALLAATLVITLTTGCGAAAREQPTVSASVATVSPSAATVSPSGAAPSAVTPSTQASPSPPPAAGPAGSIAGQLGYPSEFIPPMTVYALRVDGSGLPFYTVQTVLNQGSYMILGVAPGTYDLLDAPGGGFGTSQHFGGAYTQDVLCGLAYGCNDHSLIPVTVAPGQSVTGIAITDWYAPADSFPLIPAGGPSPLMLPSPPAAFATAQQAAIYEAQRGTGAPYLAGSFEQCPVNRACVTLGDERDGTRAAFFVGKAGSNTFLKTCAVYVVQDTFGWQPLNTACGTFPAPGVSLPVSVMGSGCINVEAGPSLTSAVVGCVAIDSTVTVDQGPVFVQEASPPNTPITAHLWWHLAGRGWISHEYLASFAFQ